MIFCSSYGQIKYALHLLETNKHTTLIIPPGFTDLRLLFNKINKLFFDGSINIPNIEPFKISRINVWYPLKLQYLLRDIVAEHKYLEEVYSIYFSKVSDSRVFFISRGCYGLEYYLLKMLTDKNELVYIDAGYPYLIPYSPKSITEKINLLILRETYGEHIQISQVGCHGGFPYIDDSIMKHSQNEHIDMSRFDYSKYKLSHQYNYEVVYFDDGLLDAGYIKDTRQFNEEIERIFSVLSKVYSKDKIAYKAHPGDSDNIMSEYPKMPSFIPAELLYNDNTLYIGICSWALAHAPKGKAISIANLITFKNSNDKKNLVDMMITESKSKILFPNSLIELEQMVTESKIGCIL